MSENPKAHSSARVSASLPKGSKFFDVDGVPVALVPTSEGGMSTKAFDPIERSFPRDSLERKGAPLSDSEFDDFVDSFQASSTPALKGQNPAVPAWAQDLVDNLNRNVMKNVRTP